MKRVIFTVAISLNAQTLSYMEAVAGFLNLPLHIEPQASAVS